MLPEVIDLFSGCGGLALGFEKAGFKITGGIELMEKACDTITYNLDTRYGRPQSHICGDITVTPAEAFSVKGNNGCIVIGGPPCQAYSMAGRSKLRSLGEDRVNTKDSRGYLFQDFLRIILGLDARCVVMENVPEAVSFGEINVPETVCLSLEEHGYKAWWTILNAADFGVPQTRERIILVAVKESENKDISLPSPTHRNSHETKTRIQRQFEKLSKNPHFRIPLSSDNCDKEWNTAGTALNDLPSLFPSCSSRYRLLPLNEGKEYKTPPQNEYQKMMREWYQRESFCVTANAFRNTKSDFPIFAQMKQGDNYLVACEIAETLFAKEVAIRGFREDTPEYELLRRKMIPVYSKDKFENKWFRLREDRPSHTVVAHLSKDTYSYIHPTEPRGISVREAARLQSFPDDFSFNCSMSDAFKQIGNAVPPLLAYAVASQIAEIFKKEK